MTSERVKKAQYDVKDGQKAQQDLGDGENMASEMVKKGSLSLEKWSKWLIMTS